jgi:copper homeostasis protein
MQANILEIACFNYESALIASNAGTDRIELCEEMELGGITPAKALLRQVKENISIPVFVMIRPRAGDFVYKEDEFSEMKKSIRDLKDLSDGFVFGILDPENNVDINRNKELVKLAFPKPCTFHRAFDSVKDGYISIDKIVSCGFKTILTSGLSPTAVQGAGRISDFIKYADRRIVIMPGGGIRSSNVSLIKKRTNAGVYHSSAVMNGNTADADEIKTLKKKLNC